MDHTVSERIVSSLPPRYRQARTLRACEHSGTLLVFDGGLHENPAIVKYHKLHSELGACEGEFESFLGRLRSLDDPHIATPYTGGVLAFGDHERFGYFVRAYVHGVPLSEVHRPIPIDQVVRALLQVSRGLEALHRVGVRHYDLKPDNVIVRRSSGGELDELSQLVLIDVIWRPHGTVDASVVNDVTLQYVAPEVTAGEQPDSRSDLYSFGVLAYQCLTGTLPFNGSNVSDIIGRQRGKVMTPVKVLRPDVPADLQRLIEQLLDPHPKNRPASASVLTSLLEQLAVTWSPRPVGRATLPIWPVFVGRKKEISHLAEALGMRSNSECKSIVEIVGDAGSGVTSLLREVHDQLETLGVVTVTAKPRAQCGVPLIEQMAPMVHRIVRQRERDGNEFRSHSSHSRLPRNATELLDDLWIASLTSRIVVIVDDVQLCEADELQLLTRVALQDRVPTAGWLARTGRCQLLLGRVSGFSEVSQLHADVSVRIEPFSAEEVAEIARRSCGSESVSLTDAKLICEETGGQAAAIMERLRLLMSGTPPQQVGRESTRSNVTQAEGKRYLFQHLRIREDFKALAALALWGEWLSADEWKLLRYALGRGLSHDADDTKYWLTQRVTSDGIEVRFRYADVRSDIRRILAGRDVSQIARELLRVTWQRWWSSRVSDARTCAQCAARLGFGVPRLRWASLRVLLVLLDAGQYEDVAVAIQTAAQYSDADSNPKWCGVIQLAVRKYLRRRTGAVGRRLRGARAQVGVWRELEWLAAVAALRQRGHYEKARRLLTDMKERLSRSPRLRVPRLSLLNAELIVAAESSDFARLKACARELRGAVRIAREAAKQGSTGTLARHRGRREDGLSPTVRRVQRLAAAWLRARQRGSAARSRYLAAAAAARRLGNIYAMLGQESRVAACVNNEGVLLLRASKLSAARVHLEHAVRMREAISEEGTVAETLINLAYVMALQGQFSNAAAVLNRARMIAERNGLAAVRDSALLNLAVAYHNGGQLASARRTYRQLVKSMANKGPRNVLATALYNYGLVALDQWHLRAVERARRLLAKACGRVEGDWAHFSPARLEAETIVRCEDWASLGGAVARESDERGRRDTTREALLASAYMAYGGDARSSKTKRKSRRREDRLALALAKRGQGGRRLRLSSARRLGGVAMAWGLPRQTLLAVEAWLHTGGVEEELEAGLTWCLRTIDARETREGYDDLHITVRGLLAARLLRTGRRREAKNMTVDSVRRFAKLARKVSGDERGRALLENIAGRLIESFGVSKGKDGGERENILNVIKSRAFDAVLAVNRDLSDAPANEREQVLEVVAGALAASSDVEDSLQRLLTAAVDVTGAERGVIVVTSEAGSKVVRKAVGGTTGGHDISWAVVSDVLESTSASLYSDALAAAELSSHRSVAELNLRSLACVPFVIDGDCRGVLYLEHRHVAGLFVREDMSLLRCLAATIGVVLQRATLSRQIEAVNETAADAREQLLRTERSRLAAQLTAGVAHDLKNISAAISARVQLLRAQVRDDSIKTALAAIERAALEGAELIDRLQDCTRDHSQADEIVVDVGRVALEALELVGPRFSGGRGSPDAEIEVVTRIAPDAFVRAVPSELREVFLNLIVNACDAMPCGGTLRVEVRSDAENDEIEITVADSGVGMSADVRARVFEPFFTTKGRKGTGLGLTIVRSVIVRCGGRVDVWSEVGRGSVFTIRLARARPEVAERRSGGSVGSEGRPENGEPLEDLERLT